MIKYPKTNNLYKREGWYYDEAIKKNTPPPEQSKRQNLIIGDYACPEFPNIRKWSVTEKIDGMNIRIHYKREFYEGSPIPNEYITFAGRTDKAQMPPKLLEYLSGHFTVGLLNEVFPDVTEVMLFGEGYGAKIQSGGYYEAEQRFVLFDILIANGWWMTQESINENAEKLGIPAVPLIGIMKEPEIVEYVKSYPLSIFAKDEHIMEGVVAKAEPLVLCRDGSQVKFKLKCKDFKNG